MKQPRLIDSSVADLIKVRLGDLPSDAELLGDNPSPALLRRIEAGEWEGAINLRQRNGKFVVIGGRRRIKALRALGYPDEFELDAYVKDWTGPEDLLAEIGFNTTAQRNRPAEVQAIVELAGMMALADVAKATGASIHDVEAAIAISHLPENIYTAFLNGEVAYGVARLTASCNPAEQGELALTLELDGRLRRVDVLELRRVTARAVDIEQLDLFVSTKEVRWSIIEQENGLLLRSSSGREGRISFDNIEWKETA